MVSPILCASAQGIQLTHMKGKAMRKLIILGMTNAIIALSATFASADPVADRRAAMDQIRFGAATLVPVLKGEKEFNPEVAELALRMTLAAAIAFEGKFPEGATSKGANPDIWAKFDDFSAKTEEFQANALKAVTTPPKSLDALKAAYEPLLANCAACHKDYRIKDE